MDAYMESDQILLERAEDFVVGGALRSHLQAQAQAQAKPNPDSGTPVRTRFYILGYVPSTVCYQALHAIFQVEVADAALDRRKAPFDR